MYLPLIYSAEELKTQIRWGTKAVPCANFGVCVCVVCVCSSQFQKAEKY